MTVSDRLRGLAMDKQKRTVIHAAADRMAANYKRALRSPCTGDALRMPSRNAVIEILRDCQKLIFPVYYGDGDLLKLPPEQYSALLMEHIHEKADAPDRADDAGVRRELRSGLCDRTAFIERMPAIQELLPRICPRTLKATLRRLTARKEVLLSTPACSPSSLPHRTRAV